MLSNDPALRKKNMMTRTLGRGRDYTIHGLDLKLDIVPYVRPFCRHLLMWKRSGLNMTVSRIAAKPRLMRTNKAKRFFSRIKWFEEYIQAIK